MTANPHLEPQLDSYLALRKPGFALMVDAPWGAGKTHAIKRWLVGKKHLLVSLYGATSREDIETAIVVARLGLEDNGTTSAVANVLGAGKDLAAGLLKLPKMTNVSKALLAGLPRLMVFDDLERTGGIPVHSLLSVLNRYVEHEGRNVVLLTNQEELRRGCEDYDRVREKVVGRIIALEPDETGALEAFLGELDGRKAHDFLSGHQEVILSVFRTSGCQNLRLLRQGLLEYARFHDIVPDDLLARAEPMRHVLATFLALTIAFHEGKDFDIDDLEQSDGALYSAMVARREDKDLVAKGYDALFARYERHPFVRLARQAISGALACTFIGRGHADSFSVEHELRAVSVFSEAEFDDWRTLWYWIKSPHDEVVKALESVRSKLNALSVTDPATILHIAGIFLDLSKHSVIPEDVNEVVLMMKEYISRAEEAGRFTPELPVSQRDESFRHGSAYGLGFYERDTESFKQITAALLYTLNEAFWARSYGLADELLELASRQPKAFANAIGRGLREEGVVDYARVPILAKADPIKAAELFCSLPPEQAHTVLDPFKDRILDLEERAEDRPRGDWPDERAWLSKVRDEILRIATETEDPIRRAQLRALVDWHLKFLDPETAKTA